MGHMDESSTWKDKHPATVMAAGGMCRLEIGLSARTCSHQNHRQI